MRAFVTREKWADASMASAFFFEKMCIFSFQLYEKKYVNLRR